MLQKCFGEFTLFRTQVFEWYKAFSEGLEVVENLPRASRPSISVNNDNISYGSTQHIVVHVLCMKRVAARLVPKDDNALSHSSLIATEFLAKHETKLIAQPPYSPDLAPCDFFLFPKFK